jgi:LPXTG-motif cell wall-anchored protein
VTRAQAKARQFRNQVRATARTASGSLVRSAQSTAALAVQPLHKLKHLNHKHLKHKHLKHKHLKHKRLKHEHQHVTHTHFMRHHVKKPAAHLALRQYVAKIFDLNNNGRLEAGDSVRFGFSVSNTGSFALEDVHVVGRRLTRFKVPVECGTTHLSPGDSTVCSSGRLKITSFQAKKGLGRNFAYALARTSNGTEVRSNSSVITLVRSTSRLQGQLPDTGADITLDQLRWAGLAVLVGVGLMLVGRLRRRDTHESGQPL